MGKILVNPTSGEMFVAQANLAKVRLQNKETLIRFPGEPGSFWRVYVSPGKKEIRYIRVEPSTVFPAVDEVGGD